MKKTKDHSTALVCLVLVAALLGTAMLGNRLGRALHNLAAPSYNTTANTLPTTDYFAVVSVSGTIQSASAGATTSVYYNHYGTINYIYELVDDPLNKGIFLNLDTPGGAVYETDELYLALEYYKEATGRPIMAYMNRQACSGGYYVAMAADTIYANRNATTGSIGVIITHSNYAGLYEKLGISTDYIVSGGNKAMGAGDRPLTEEQRAIYQGVVDEAYAQFTDIICQGRNMELETLLPLADGRIYTAQQAVDLGLIDGLRSQDEALSAFSSQLGGCDWYYKDLAQYSLLDYLLAKADGIAPKTEAEMVEHLLANAQDGTAFYLAA